jgi:hypothetical protein
VGDGGRVDLGGGDVDDQLGLDLDGLDILLGIDVEAAEQFLGRLDAGGLEQLDDGLFLGGLSGTGYMLPSRPLVMRLRHGSLRHALWCGARITCLRIQVVAHSSCVLRDARAALLRMTNRGGLL